MALCRFRGPGDLVGGPRPGRVGRGAGGVPVFVHAPFHQPAAQETQTEESDSIPASVPAAPPSAQRSWTDRPECGEHCCPNSSWSSCAVLSCATLKVCSGISFFLLLLPLLLNLIPFISFLSTQGCQQTDTFGGTAEFLEFPVIHTLKPSHRSDKQKSNFG